MHPSNPGAECATAPLLLDNGAGPSLRVAPSGNSAIYQSGEGRTVVAL